MFPANVFPNSKTTSNAPRPDHLWIIFDAPEIQFSEYCDFASDLYIGSMACQTFLRMCFNIENIYDFNYYFNGEKINVFRSFDKLSPNLDPITITIVSKD